jgi:hypothetical protein
MLTERRRSLIVSKASFVIDFFFLFCRDTDRSFDFRIHNASDEKSRAVRRVLQC